MFKLLLFLHLLAAIFAVGPLVGVATSASRAVRASDAGAATSAARMVRLYSYVSVVVVIFGMGLMSQDRGGEKVAEIGDTWIWLSLLLWAAATAVALGVLAPAMTRAAAEIGGSGTAGGLVGRVAAAGGVIGLVYAVIVLLMVYRPGG